MDDNGFVPPHLERIAWERRLVRGLAGHTFSETLLITEPSASDGADRDDIREGRQPQPRPPWPLLRRDASRAYLLLRLLSHDKLHVATILASEVREDKATGIMIQETGPYYVVKVVRLDCLAIDPIENPFNEAAALQLLLQNEGLLGTLPPSLPRLHAAFKDQHHLYLMTPYAPGGDLFNYLARRPPARRHLSERKACAFLLDIVEALTYLKKNGMAHRDVSLENVVLALGEVMTEEEVWREEAEDWIGSAPSALYPVAGGGGGAAAAAAAAAAVAGGQQRRVHDQCVLLPAPYPEVLLGEQAFLPTMPHFFHSTGYGPAPPPGSHGPTHHQQAGHVPITVGQEMRAAEASALEPSPPPQAHHYRHHYYNVLHPPSSSSSPSYSSNSSSASPPPHPSLPPPPRRHWRCTLIDLGMASRLPESKDGIKIRRSYHQSRGKPGYVSPEIFYEQPSDGFSSDIWSLGVILYTLLTGHPLYASPWDPAFEALVGGKTRRLIHHYKLKYGCSIHLTAEDLICAMLNPCPSERPCLAQIKASAWVCDVLRGRQEEQQQQQQQQEQRQQQPGEIGNGGVAVAAAAVRSAR